MSGPGAAPIAPVLPGIFRARGDAGAAVLLGGHCARCARHYFPRPALCPRCLGAIAEVELGASGRIYSYTVVRTKAPLGLPQPYAVGYVDLDGCALRVFGLLDATPIERLRIGMAVRLQVAPVGHDGGGRPCLRPCFTATGAPA